MTNDEIKELAALWIASEGKYSPAFDQLDDLLFDDAETGWRVIQEIAARELPEEAMAVFAAGPVETLLARHGQKFIDRVEEKARLDPKFNYILGGVWQNAMPNEIWRRVEKARKKVW